MDRRFPLLLVAALLPVVQPVAPGVSDRNQPYVDGGSPDQVLDFDAPGIKGFSTVIFIHGGSLQESGERRNAPVYARVCEPFLVARMACATIDYRLAPSHRWPAMPLDVAAAVKWIKARVAGLGGDPTRLFLFGHSSGCTLAPLEEATTRLTMDQLRERWPKSGEVAIGEPLTHTADG